MLKKIIIATLATGALALNAPVAGALEPAAVNCQLRSVSQASVTGGQDTFTGAASGAIVSGTPGNAVSLRCFIRVNGADVATTPTGTGTTVTTTAGQVTFTATDSDDVDLCAAWTDGAASGLNCVDTAVTQIPPQAVIDLIAETTAGLDPIICTVLKAAMVPTVVNLAAPVLAMDPDDCDLYVNGERFIDFVPYED